MKILHMITLLLSAAVYFATWSYSQAQEIDKTFSGIEEVRMEIASGDVTFVKSSDADVHVKLKHTFNIEYNPTVEKRGTRLIIQDERNRGSYSGSSTWTIGLPDNLEIDFTSGSSDVEISGISVDADMNSGSGTFELSNVQGEFEINTGSGNIIAEDVNGELQINSGSGDIILHNVVSEVDANVGSGDIEAVRVSIRGRSSFNTGSGDVEVELSKPADYDISVNSGSGDATLDFGGNAIEGTIVMRANKRNGSIKAPFDFDSSEEIDNGNSTVVKKTKKLGTKNIDNKVGTGSGTAKILR